jgi:hypothetical protein
LASACKPCAAVRAWVRVSVLELDVRFGVGLGLRRWEVEEIDMCIEDVRDDMEDEGVVDGEVDGASWRNDSMNA